MQGSPKKHHPDHHDKIEIKMELSNLPTKPRYNFFKKSQSFFTVVIELFLVIL